jgi:hypothetical protein
MFVKAYNETREHGGINGLTPSEMFLQRLIKSKICTKKKQESVIRVANQNCVSTTTKLTKIVILSYKLPHNR